MATSLTDTRKVWKVEWGWKFILLLSATMCLSLFQIYKRGLEYARIMRLSKHSTHKGPRWGFPYHNLTTPHGEVISYPPTWGLAEQLCGLSHGNLHQCSVVAYAKFWSPSTWTQKTTWQLPITGTKLNLQISILLHGKYSCISNLGSWRQYLKFVYYIIF